MKKFILGCRFSFESYAKNVGEKATKCFLKTTEALWMLMDMCLHKFDIHRGTLPPNCFKSRM